MTLLEKIIEISSQRGKVKPTELIQQALSLLASDYPEIESIAFGWKHDVIVDYSRTSLQLKEINGARVDYSTKEEFLSLVVEANTQEHRFLELVRVLNRFPQFKEMVYDIHQKESKIHLALKKTF